MPCELLDTCSLSTTCGSNKFCTDKYSPKVCWPCPSSPDQCVKDNGHCDCKVCKSICDRKFRDMIESFEHNIMSSNKV